MDVKHPACRSSKVVHSEHSVLLLSEAWVDQDRSSKVQAVPSATELPLHQNENEADYMARSTTSIMSFVYLIMFTI